jgi:ribosomal protein S27AE
MWVAKCARYEGLLEGIKKGVTLPHLVGWRCTECGYTRTADAREEPDKVDLDLNEQFRLKETCCPKCNHNTRTETKVFTDVKQLQEWLTLERRKDEY